MPWPSWLSFWHSKPNDSKQQEATARDASTPAPVPTGSWANSLNATDWSHYTSPQTIIACAITSATTLAFVRVYRTYLRRIPTVDYLKPSLFRRRNLYGYVTRVGDGDNFHIFHTPGGKWMGWGWLPNRRIQDLSEKQVRGKTVHVRLAGVDAPELAHFGRPSQPYSQEALDWLKGFVLHRYVRAYPYRKDQYERVVCSVYRRRWFFFRSDVGLNMLKQGLATVYEAKFGSEFGDNEAEYRAAEERAKQRKIGMWQQPGLIGKILGKTGSFESPREYKTRMAQQEKNEKTANAAK